MYKIQKAKYHVLNLSKLVKFFPLFLLITSCSNNQEIKVKAPNSYSFEKDSVRQLKIRGKYGRYITFNGRTTN